MPEDDPTELFDLCDREGMPLGRSKARSLVHRDGDWHRSVHVWVVLASEGGPSVLLQRRSLSKDTHPGKVDVSVAGHLCAGETDGSAAAAVREAEEEIGLAVDEADLVRLWTRRREDVREGHADRELQDIFYVVTARDLESLRPDPDEVLGLLAVRLDDARALVAGETAEVAAREVRVGGAVGHEVVLRRDELLPAPDGYFATALESIAARLGGSSGVEGPPWGGDRR